jgi:hypothetical protein
LGDNGIGEKGAIALAETLKTNTSVTYIKCVLWQAAMWT